MCKRYHVIFHINYAYVIYSIYIIYVYVYVYNEHNVQEKRLVYADMPGTPATPRPCLPALLPVPQWFSIKCQLYAGKQGPGAVSVHPTPLTGAVYTNPIPVHTLPGECWGVPSTSLFIPTQPCPSQTLHPRPPFDYCFLKAVPRRLFFSFKENHFCCFLTSEMSCRAQTNEIKPTFLPGVVWIQHTLLWWCPGLWARGGSPCRALKGLRTEPSFWLKTWRVSPKLRAFVYHLHNSCCNWGPPVLFSFNIFFDQHIFLFYLLQTLVLC